MTVSTEVDHNDYTGNGVTTAFPYTFRIYKKPDLLVTVFDLDENTTELVLDTNYTVTGAGAYQGGNVVLTTPLANGWKISIERVLPVTQETDLRNQGKFFAEVHEDAFDKLTMLIQQALGRFSLALRKPTFIANYYDALNNRIRNLSDPSQPQDAATKNYVDALESSNISKALRVPENIPPFPSAEIRANKVAAFDSQGNPIVVVPQSGSAADVMIQLASTESGKADSLIDFRQPYAGAVSKTVHDKFLEIVSPLDWGVKPDGTDCTAQWQSFVSYVNNIPNPNGIRVGVHIPTGSYKFSQTLWFTRPVHVYGYGVEINYTGTTGDGIKLGPDGLSYYMMPDGTNNKWYHQTYSIHGINFVGGTTSGAAIRFAWWIINCFVTNCEFRFFGGNGSWAIVAEYHNWFVTVKDCVFEAHYTEAVAGGPDESITRNFVYCPGFVTKSDGNYADMWATRTLCENNRVYSSSRVRGGISYLLSGWKSRVVGGSSEGMLKDLVLACGIGDMEVNNFYMEKNFQPFSGEVSTVIQISYTGDAYYDTVKRERPGTTPEDVAPNRLVRRPRINGFYGNFKSDSGLENYFIYVMPDKDISIDSLYVQGCTLIRYTGPLVTMSDVQGNRNWSIDDISWDGDINNYRGLIEPVLASKYKPGYVTRVKNLIKVSDASQLASGFNGVAPTPAGGFKYGVTGIAAVSDGTGGDITFTYRDTFTDAAHFYERNLVDMQARVFNTFCTTPPAGHGVMRIEFDLDIVTYKLQDTFVMLSFYAKSIGGTFPVSAALRYTPSNTTYQGTRAVQVTPDAWRRYSIPIRALDLPLGSTLAASELAKLLLIFPAGSAFQIEIAAPVLNIGPTAYPIRACY